jgi:hypothetical protein
LTLHSFVAVDVGVFDVAQSERAAAVHVACELCCEVLAWARRPGVRRHIQMAVSAFSAVSNSTTPDPRDRPPGSYWISARSTLPIVVNSSTKSSLLVDQGSCIAVSVLVLSM